MPSFYYTDQEKKQWGSYCWYLLHVIAFNFTETRRSYYTEFFLNLGAVLPCPTCAAHYSLYLQKNPITSTTDFAQWVIDCHNNVNRITHKPILSASEARKLFIVDNVCLANHKYIHRLLKIFLVYHQEVNTVPIYKQFLERLRKIFPCDLCRLALKNRPKTLEYLSIISGKNCPESKIQKINIS